MKTRVLVFFLALMVGMASWAQAPNAGRKIKYKSIKSFIEATGRPEPTNINRYFTARFTKNGMYFQAPGMKEGVEAFYKYKGKNGNVYIYETTIQSTNGYYSGLVKISLDLKRINLVTQYVSSYCTSSPTVTVYTSDLHADCDSGLY